MKRLPGTGVSGWGGTQASFDISCGEQNKMKKCILFENSNDLSVQALKRYAIKVPLNADEFNACLESGKYAGEIEKEIAEGSQAGVSGTPAFFIGPSAGP